MGKYGITSDIRKAFQMIEVNDSDRDFLRFFWWENFEQKKVITYRHNRVVFGMNCSSFLLGAVINFHLDGLHNRFPDTVGKLKRSLYIDNSVLAVDSLKEYEKFKKEATEILNMAKMDLRQWERNGDDGEAISTVLGMKWNKVEDVLLIDSIPAQIPMKITKRLILSQIHQIFDPLGFLSPVVLVPKLLIQKAWAEDKKWDEEVTSAVKEEFVDWWTELALMLPHFSVPRRFTSATRNESENLQFHVFSDASKGAYAAAVFMRTEINGVVELQLVEAKARVAPIRKVTIPRLELLGCCIAARLMDSVKKALDLEHVPTWYWSDSSTALSWIKNNDDWGTFVGNRVREILSLTNTGQWNFVPGSLNPADLPSRGISPRKFLESKWWEGPNWLKKKEHEWPEQEFEMDFEEVNKERKKRTVCTLVCSIERRWYMPKNSYLSNVRIFAYVLRFLEKLRKKGDESKLDLSGDEVKAAEFRLFKLVQEEAYPSGETKVAGVVKDREGLLRVKTKITNRKDTADFILPVLLPYSHPLVNAIISETHVFESHGGAQFVMGKLREKFWIVKGRLAVKKVIRACVICQRFNAKKLEAPSAPLPEPRVKDAEAYEVIGIDLTGPLTLKDKTKRWIVLFTCAVYRCVHLELVEAISTVEFIMAFIRFCRRKTRPSIVFTDCGTNFRGAVNLWEEIDWDEVKRRTQQFRVEWRFSPPSAPWWGGFWERLVRSLKDLLKRMLGSAKLGHQDLETCVCEVEWVLNHRPLTFVTEDPEDLVPLTPAMFIHDLPQQEELPEIQALTAKKLKEKRVKLKILLEELKGRFRKEYLGILIQREKDPKQTKKLEVGDLVFIGDDNMKRVLWPMGRITALCPGKDGITRVAKVKTKNGELVRPIRRLYPLELSPDTSMMAGIEWKPVPLEGQEEQLKEKAGLPKRLVKTRSGRTVKKVRFFDD